MTPQDKNAILQFMGQIYGETKRHDQMLVGQAKDLRPTSDTIKNVFEQTLRSPVQGQVQAPVSAPVPAPVPQVQTSPAPQLIPVPQIAPPPAQLNEDQLEFDLRDPTKLDKIIDLLQRQNNLLSELNKNVSLVLNSRANNLKIKNNGKDFAGKGPG